MKEYLREIMKERVFRDNHAREITYEIVFRVLFCREDHKGDITLGIVNTVCRVKPYPEDLVSLQRVNYKNNMRDGGGLILAPSIYRLLCVLLLLTYICLHT
jgi:hypothetical protein